MHVNRDLSVHFEQHAGEDAIRADAYNMMGQRPTQNSAGILAYGSILDHLGEALAAAVTGRIERVTTPFAVEFARSSRTRNGAPTLVPVAQGGAPVAGAILVLDDALDESEARDLLYKRETGLVNEPPTCANASIDWIASIPNLYGLDFCLYTALPANIAPLTAGRLAKLAVSSAAHPAGETHRDGISYLSDQKARGVRTLLMPDYEAAVLALTGAPDLAAAWDKARSCVTG